MRSSAESAAGIHGSVQLERALQLGVETVDRPEQFGA